MDIHHLANFHVSHSSVKSSDHLTDAADKLQRLPAVVRRIKLGSIVECTSVMGTAGFSHIASREYRLRSTSAAASSTGMTIVMAAAAASAGVIFPVTSAGMTFLVIAAAVSLLMMMVITVRSGRYQFAFQISFHRLIRIPLSTGAKLHTCLLKGSLRSAANTAADQYIHGLSGKKPCQCAMSNAIGTDHFAGNYLVVLHIIYLEKLCFSKMLKNISVIISYRYFHL